MGHTEQLPERDRYLYAKEYLLDRLAVMMGGRAAEEVFKGTSTSGAELDLKQATRLTRKMVLDWGMGDRLNRVALGEEQEDVFLGREIAKRRDYSEETAREVDEEVQSLLTSAYERAEKALRDRKEGVTRLVERLLEEEEVAGEDVLRLIGVDLNEEETVGARA
jgi:cell division protease FtsH